MHVKDCWQRTFAGLYALDPCVIEVCVPGISTLLEPSTAASATAEFAGFLDSRARGAPAPAACRGETHVPRRRDSICGMRLLYHNRQRHATKTAWGAFRHTQGKRTGSG